MRSRASTRPRSASPRRAAAPRRTWRRRCVRHLRWRQCPLLTRGYRQPRLRQRQLWRAWRRRRQLRHTPTRRCQRRRRLSRPQQRQQPPAGRTLSSRGGGRPPSTRRGAGQWPRRCCGAPSLAPASTAAVTSSVMPWRQSRRRRMTTGGADGRKPRSASWSARRPRGSCKCGGGDWLSAGLSRKAQRCSGRERRPRLLQIFLQTSFTKAFCTARAVCIWILLLGLALCIMWREDIENVHMIQKASM
ncbi:unnamed protein product [Phaeothamnion confervicola]